VDVLDELGGGVEIGGSAAGADTALLLVDQLGEADRRALRDWVAGGRVLVIADPASTITRVEVAGGPGGLVSGLPLERGCRARALRGADRVQTPIPVLFSVPPEATGCFTRGDGAWLLLQPLGEGTVVRLGGAEALTNQELAAADNAVVAVSLLAPAPDTRTVILDPPEPGGGQQTLTDLIHPRVRTALLQLLVAFVVLAAWRGRRLGRPVREPQPVSIPASELVVAVGNLLQRGRQRQHAAALLAADLRRTLCERLGLPPGMDDADIAAAAAARTGIDAGKVLAALRAGPVAREADLVTLAETVEAVRDRVVQGR
jgi:hypothetical protein